MRFEEVLPEIRKGRKARRKGQVGNDFDPSDRYSDHSIEDFLADDWELVPEKRKPKAKHRIWLNLYSDSKFYICFDAHLAREDFESRPNGFVETRVIEWEVE